MNNLILNKDGVYHINDLANVNNHMISKFLHPNVRFKTLEPASEDKTCNATKKIHQEISFQTQTNIPYTGNSNYFSSNNKQKRQTIFKEGPYQVDQDKLDKVFKRSFFLF